MTSTLTIERLDVRYHAVRPGEAAALDGALARAIAVELADAVTLRMPSTDLEVCVPELVVAIEIDDPRNWRLVASQWADEVVEAITRRVESSSGIVTYRNRIEALVDLVLSVGRGNSERLWAWQQIGIVNADVSAPTSEHVMRALIAQPDAVPGVLRRIAVRGELRLDPGEWIRLANVMDQFLGAMAIGPTGAPTVNLKSPNPVERVLAQGLPWDLVDERGQLCLARLVAAASCPDASMSYACVREIARRWSHQFGRVKAAEDNVADSTHIGKLLDPQSSGFSESLGSAARNVASHGRPPSDEATASPSNSDELDGIQRLDAPGPTSASSSSYELAVTQGIDALDPANTAWLVDESTAASTAITSSDDEIEGIHQVENLGFSSAASSDDDLADSTTIDPSGVPALPTIEWSSFGGVVFTVHCLRAIGLVERIVDTPEISDPPTILAHVLAEASDADPSDPSVRLIAGCETEQDAQDLDPETATQVTAWSREVVAWLQERLEVDASDDLSWFWNRRVEIRLEPGWIEIVLPLDSVDFAIRRGGLDVDPGFVWWLGSIVRYRYV